MHVDHFYFSTQTFAAGLGRARRQLLAFARSLLKSGAERRALPRAGSHLLVPLGSAPLAAQTVFILTCLLPVAALAQSPLESIAVPRVIAVDESFAYAPSPATGSAAWSAEFMTREMLAVEAAERPASFYVDRDVPAELRASTRDYAGSGYDMGHLAPNGDTPDGQAKIRRARLSNVVPQAPGLNRGWWKRLEEHVRDLVGEHGAAFVVTAPVYAKQGRPQIVGNLVAPTHLVKCVLLLQVDTVKQNGGQVDGVSFREVSQPSGMRAWVVPNQTPPAAATLDSYRRPVDACEELLQLDLFGWLDDETETRMEAAR